MDEDNIWISSAQLRKTDDSFQWKLPLAIWKRRIMSLRLMLSKDVGQYKKKTLKTRFHGLDHSPVWAGGGNCRVPAGFQKELTFPGPRWRATLRKGGKSSKENRRSASQLPHILLLLLKFCVLFYRLIDLKVPQITSIKNAQFSAFQNSCRLTEPLLLLYKTSITSKEDYFFTYSYLFISYYLFPCFFLLCTTESGNHYST